MCRLDEVLRDVFLNPTDGKWSKFDEALKGCIKVETCYTRVSMEVSN